MIFYFFNEAGLGWLLPPWDTDTRSLVSSETLSVSLPTANSHAVLSRRAANLGVDLANALKVDGALQIKGPKYPATLGPLHNAENNYQQDKWFMKLLKQMKHNETHNVK